ncbi:hypothetical protein ACH4U7_22715 [Streptomyces sp. NPDC020845]|uniref:hypothetical protein n=1 Tax=Streptomyces sp. NPDC020845 TaxID=3365096 RepID=UPI003789F9DE
MDLWLGVPGGLDEPDVADETDLSAILSGERLPALRSLGPENSSVQDEIAEMVASAPVVAQLRSLGPWTCVIVMEIATRRVHLGDGRSGTAGQERNDARRPPGGAALAASAREGSLIHFPAPVHAVWSRAAGQALRSR